MVCYQSIILPNIFNFVMLTQLTSTGFVTMESIYKQSRMKNHMVKNPSNLEERSYGTIYLEKYAIVTL